MEGSSLFVVMRLNRADGKFLQQSSTGLSSEKDLARRKKSLLFGATPLAHRIMAQIPGSTGVWSPLNLHTTGTLASRWVNVLHPTLDRGVAHHAASFLESARVELTSLFPFCAGKKNKVGFLPRVMCPDTSIRTNRRVFLAPKGRERD